MSFLVDRISKNDSIVLKKYLAVSKKYKLFVILYPATHWLTQAQPAKTDIPDHDIINGNRAGNAGRDG